MGNDFADTIHADQGMSSEFVNLPFVDLFLQDLFFLSVFARHPTQIVLFHLLQSLLVLLYFWKCVVLFEAMGVLFGQKVGLGEVF